MLTLARFAASVALLGAIVVGPATAAVAGPPIATDGSANCQNGVCLVKATDPARTKKPAPARAPGGDSAPAVPASNRGGGPAAPPAQIDLAGQNHANTYCAAAKAGGNTPPECQPKPQAPVQNAAPAPPAFVPADATRMALDKLVVPQAQINTPLCAGCSTLVGLPMWVWTQPWQEQTATATAGPYTVTAVARPVQITWQLGDGSPAFVCRDAGKPYNDAYGMNDPYCGGRYQRRGVWNLTATWTWQVTWSGAATGSSIMNTVSSRAVPVQESQAIIQSNS